MEEDNKVFRGSGKKVERWKTPVKGENLRINKWDSLFGKIKQVSFRLTE